MLFGPTIFLSALLLFLVELILGKFILPWFGGAPAVWTTCVLFFQILLLLGYSYAHLTSARLSPRTQAGLHLGLLATSLTALLWFWHLGGSPVLPPAAWKPDDPGKPVWKILKLLGSGAGLPFFLLASTSPLLQRWYSLARAEKRPYRLYAVSNVGSMSALLAYPVLVEPHFSLSAQGRCWGILYALFAGLCGICAIRTYRRPGRIVAVKKHPAAEPQQSRPDVRSVCLWVLLAAATSAMFLSVTNNLCQDVAVVPFLWVLPLAIYLLSFILCFESDRWYRRNLFVLATAGASVVVLITAFLNLRLSLFTNASAYCVFLFLFCMTCHGELVRLKPRSGYLTLFYLVIASGGAIGGVFVGLIAPAVFKSFWEFHITLMAGWILLALIFARDRHSFFHTGDRWQFAAFFLLLIYLVVQAAFLALPSGGSLLLAKYSPAYSVAVAFLGSAVIAAVAWSRRIAHSRYWPRLLAGAVIFLAECFMLQRIRSTGLATIDVQRNFYGVVRVLRAHVNDRGHILVMSELMHGAIAHGFQFQDPLWKDKPVGYYSPGSGLAMAFRLHPRRLKSAEPLRIGVLGLGAGTVAAFARDGDFVRFYEINPAVAGYSTGADPVFTYLRDCHGRADVVMGDARLSLEKELRQGNPERFDILAMDAFSGDSVPVHLVTEEAFRLYLKHLRDDNGIIAVNISNRLLDLRDLMLGIAGRLGLHAVIVRCDGEFPDFTPSLWCLMTRNGEFVQQAAIQDARENYQPERAIVWTDEFSNLLQLVRW